MFFPVSTLPDEDGANGWTSILPPRAPRSMLEGREAFEWAVLGAGFTGLAAARRLAELRPGDRIAVVDAGAVGEGASGRNSGFAIDHAHALGGAENAGTMPSENRLYTEALRKLRALVEEHGVDCAWRESGKYHAAMSARGAEQVLKPLLRHLEDAGEPCRWCDRAVMAEATGAQFYEAGVFTPGTVLVNPAALIRGVADALPENVTLYENTEVKGIETGSRVMLWTDEGAVEARGLILATNAYTPALGFFRRQLLPLIAFASLTAPMSDAQRKALGGAASWGVTPADGFLAPTIQRTGDHRILFRYDIRYRPGLRLRKGELKRMGARHRAAFRKRFPMLADLSLDHTWSGYLCTSANQHSAFGEVGDKIWVAAGHQGVGVARGTIAGTLIADVASGNDNPLIADMQKIASPPAGPPRPFLDWGVRARLAWNRFANRHEG